MAHPLGRIFLIKKMELMKKLLILLIPTFLLGCGVFGEPWPEVRTLSDTVMREAKNSVRAKYFRVDKDTATVIYTNQYGDQMQFWFAWPVEWGVIIMPADIRTESGDDPEIIRAKYRGSF
jgi:hypothetical protein